MIMAWSLPPKLAPTQVVIIPIYRSEEELLKLDAVVKGLSGKLKKIRNPG